MPSAHAEQQYVILHIAGAVPFICMVDKDRCALPGNERQLIGCVLKPAIQRHLIGNVPCLLLSGKQQKEMRHRSTRTTAWQEQEACMGAFQLVDPDACYGNGLSGIMRNI